MDSESKIYTRTGDNGTTSLGDSSRVSKFDSRIEAYSTVDEANSAIGLAISFLGDGSEILDASRLQEVLQRLQHELFDLGADIARPIALGESFQRATQTWIDDLEKTIDDFQGGLPELSSFILPGGSTVASALHIARTVARRAERATWAAIDAHGADLPGGVNTLAAQYLNRLSDLLFVLARTANNGQDVLWVRRAER
ncbi:MAG: hypothetical protein RLZZ400_132 [Actinomycetota bacterium]|jgi:cob(I)alamin adenosyltransferase